jgi:aminoglycoside 2''-phosphotransferase
MIMKIVLEKQETYLQAIQKSYPSLAIHSVRLHSSQGQFNDIFLINEDLIFRFPRYEDHIPEFLDEIKILEKLQGLLTVPIPQPIYASVETKSVGEVFMGYKFLPGKPLSRKVLDLITDELILESLAHQLASFLHELHCLSLSTLGLASQAPGSLEEFKELFSKITEYLFPSMHAQARQSVTRHFEDYFANPALHEFEPAMIHADFGGSNILFAQDKITGVIDFSSSGPGDPAVDIAAVSTLGESFFARICKHYVPGAALLQRAQFYRGTFALSEALHGYLNHDREAFRRGMEQYR